MLVNKFIGVVIIPMDNSGVMAYLFEKLLEAEL